MFYTEREWKNLHGKKVSIVTTLSGKKGLALCILRVLENHSSREHPLTIAQIEEHVAREFGMEAGRNAVARNLSLLREMGYPVRSGAGKRGAYLEPLFSDTELRVLIDSVLLSRYIPPDEARALIAKLTRMGRAGFSNGVEDVCAVDKWHRTHHRDFFECMDGLSRAVRAHVQVRFTYNHVGLDGELTGDGRVRQVHPLSLVCAQGQYYLLACYDGSQEVRHFRVDHIANLEVTDLPACTPYDLPAFRGGVDMARYAAEHRYMYSGEPVRVTLRMPMTAAGQVYDAFGHYAHMTPCPDGKTMEVRLDSSLENMRIFALQYAGVCEVIAPPELRRMVRQDVQRIAQRYEEGRTAQ